MNEQKQRTLPPRKLKEAKKQGAIAEAIELGRLKAKLKMDKIKKDPLGALQSVILDMVKKPSDLAEATLIAGLAYLGYDKFKSYEGALLGPVSLKLAQSDNLIAGAAGVLGLVSLGLAAIGPKAEVWENIIPGLGEVIDNVETNSAKVDDIVKRTENGLIGYDQCIAEMAALNITGFGRTAYIKCSTAAALWENKQHTGVAP